MSPQEKILIESLIRKTISGVSEYDMCRLISISHEWGLKTDELIKIYNSDKGTDHELKNFLV